MHQKQSKDHNSETEKRRVTIILFATLRLDLIHIPVKFREDILPLQSYGAHNIFLRFSKSHNSETKKGRQSFSCGTLCLVQIYISIKHHEDILNIVYGRTDRGAYKNCFLIVKNAIFA